MGTMVALQDAPTPSRGRHAKWHQVAWRGMQQHNQHDCKESSGLLRCAHLLPVCAQPTLGAIGNHAHATTHLHIAHAGRPTALRPNLKATVVASVAQHRALPISTTCALQVRRRQTTDTADAVAPMEPLLQSPWDLGGRTRYCACTCRVIILHLLYGEPLSGGVATIILTVSNDAD